MLAILAMAASAASAPPLPSYLPRDAFVFSDGRVEQVVRVEGESVVWSGLGGSPYVRSRNFIVPVLSWQTGRGVGIRTVRGEPDRLWPLAGPASARFRVITETQVNPMAAARRTVSLWSCRTNRPHTVQVRAGSFLAIPIACDRYSAASMRLTERLEWDYAPEIGHYVRRSSFDYLRGARRTIELVATLSGPSATRSRLAALSRAARGGD